MPRSSAPAAVLAGFLLLAACSAPPAPAGPDCTAYERYGNLAGTTITFLGPDDPAYPASFAPFEACTGADVAHEGVTDTAVRLPQRIRAGTPPDVAHIVAPALLDALVRDTGAVVPMPPQVAVNVEQSFPDALGAAGSVDGTRYAAPLGVRPTSLVRYSPDEFAASGYTVPPTRAELLALADRIAADGTPPWCAVGSTTLVDELEAAVLDGAGPDVYEGWTEHTVPSDDPRIVAALDRVGAMHRTHPAGDPPDCALARAPGPGAAFPLPPTDPTAGRSLLVAADFAAAFSDRPEVAAFQAYLSSAEWARAMAAQATAGWISAHSGLDPTAVPEGPGRTAVELLRDPSTIVGYDASDLMPAAVGSRALPAALAAWLSGTDSRTALGSVEPAWPQ